MNYMSNIPFIHDLHMKYILIYIPKSEQIKDKNSNIPSSNKKNKQAHPYNILLVYT